MQLFTTNEDAPRRDIGTGVRCFEIAVAPIVANAVDDTGCSHWDPHHLYRPDGRANGAEQGHVDDEHQPHTLPCKARINIAL